MGALVTGCQASWSFPWGVSADRMHLSQSQWLTECERVSAFLQIPPEQHLGRWSTRYGVRSLVQPLGGLVCDRLLLWVLADQERGKLCATLHWQDVNGPWPVVVREVCEGRARAWAEADGKFPATLEGIQAREAWVTDRARRLLYQWWGDTFAKVFGHLDVGDRNDLVISDL